MSPIQGQVPVGTESKREVTTLKWGKSLGVGGGVCREDSREILLISAFLQGLLLPISVHWDLLLRLFTCPLLLLSHVRQTLPWSHYLKPLCGLIHQEAPFSLLCPLSVLLACLLSAPFRNVDKALFPAD